MPRYFTLEQAERTLPRVESAVREALRLKSEYHMAEMALRELKSKVMMSGGMNIDRDSAMRVRQTRDNGATRLQEALDSIHEFGCQVKDLDIGLLDFPAMYRGREVCLCWRLGEERIGFWHEPEAGFQGRKPIDDDFRANHRGDGAGPGSPGSDTSEQ
ncbi:MAG: DUF2203 domain-containing protein [Bryobacteraceae bacterium]|nr:DUF2203 domain-containing protein [Bryobacteraceae bacterium]